MKKIKIPAEKIVRERNGAYTILWPNLGYWIRTNEVGKKVLELYNNLSVEEIVEKIATAYSVNPKDIEEDVIDFITSVENVFLTHSRENKTKFVLESCSPNDLEKFINDLNTSNHFQYIHVIRNFNDIENIENFSNMWRKIDTVGVWVKTPNFDPYKMPSKVREVYLDMMHIKDTACLKELGYAFKDLYVDVFLLFYSAQSFKQISQYFKFCEENHFGISLMRVPKTREDDVENYSNLVIQLLQYLQRRKTKINFALDYPFCYEKFDLRGQNERCIPGKNMFYISSDGRIFPCPYLTSKKFLLGNIKENKHTDLMNKFQNRCAFKELYCAECIYRELCGGGCKAITLLEGVNKDPYCKALQRILGFLLFSDSGL